MLRRSLLDFVREKVGNLGALGGGVGEVEVMLILDASGAGEDKLCKLRISIAGQQFSAVKRSVSFERATLSAIECLQEQLEEWNARNRGNAGENKNKETSQRNL